jgi:protein TonB
MPLRGDDDYRVGAAVSIGLHVLILLLVLTPFVVATMIAAPPTGAGGDGPAGGGGGGTGGTGGSEVEYTPERLRYIQVGPAQVAPPAPAAEAQPVPPTPPPPEEEPEPTPPVPQTPPAPTAEPLAGSADAQRDVASATIGTGGGTGDDGTAGSGPGSGGGIGSGIGIGIGSGEGPGTGGGTGNVYLPTPTLQVFPNRKPRAPVAGDTIPVSIEVDEAGRVVKIEFPPTRDRGYNRYLLEVLESWKFRPAVRADGTPVRAIYPLVIGPL